MKLRIVSLLLLKKAEEIFQAKVEDGFGRLIRQKSRLWSILGQHDLLDHGMEDTNRHRLVQSFAWKLLGERPSFVVIPTLVTMDQLCLVAYRMTIT